MNLFGRRKRALTKSEGTPAVEDRLTTLCNGNERMHKALSNFLLLRPEEQISQLGPTDALIVRADSTEKSDPIIARANLETAARIELYKGDREKVKSLLERVQRLRTDGEAERETIISDLDNAMSIAREYYHQKQASKIEESPISVRV